MNVMKELKKFRMKKAKKMYVTEAEHMYLNKYPRTQQFLQDTGMSLDQALVWTEEELNKIKQGNKEV